MLKYEIWNFISKYKKIIFIKLIFVQIHDDKTKIILKMGLNLLLIVALQYLIPESFYIRKSTKEYENLMNLFIKFLWLNLQLICWFR